jgi:hypothetical protein
MPLPVRARLQQADDTDGPEVMIMTGKTRAAPRLVRLARLLIGPNKLRRPSDRIEGFIVLLLSAAFAAAVVAAPFFGVHLYQSQRADAARLHPATAVLTQGGPSNGYMASQGEAAARWRAPDGRQEKGILTTVTAPAITGAPAGTRVKVWLTETGQPQAPPASAVEETFSSVVLSVGAVCGSAIALLICYWVCRLAIDRRRLAAWASEWSLTGPRWTTRL